MRILFPDAAANLHTMVESGGVETREEGYSVKIGKEDEKNIMFLYAILLLCMLLSLVFRCVFSFQLLGLFPSVVHREP